MNKNGSKSLKLSHCHCENKGVQVPQELGMLLEQQLNVNRNKSLVEKKEGLSPYCATTIGGMHWKTICRFSRAEDEDGTLLLLPSLNCCPIELRQSKEVERRESSVQPRMYRKELGTGTELHQSE